MSRKTKRLKPAPVVPPPAAQPAPLPAELLTAPSSFGKKLRHADTTALQYWPAPVIAGALSGVAYALLLRSGLNLAMAEALRAAGKTGGNMPTVISHITNGFGSFFLTILTFGVMWGLGRLGAGKGPDLRGARVAEIYSASFALLVPLYLLSIVLTLFTPAAAWALNPAEVTRASGDLLELQRAGLHSAAQTPAALALLVASLLGTLGQFGLAYPALRETTGNPGKALLAVLLPLLPALALQVIAVGPLLTLRQ